MSVRNHLVALVESEDLPHKSGITTSGILSIFHSHEVGRLAPQIGDYDLLPFRITWASTSEDLPHKSGITTVQNLPSNDVARSEDLPHKSGITTV